MWRRLCRIGEDGGVARLPDVLASVRRVLFFSPGKFGESPVNVRSLAFG
jgi:hypothetical protein